MFGVGGIELRRERGFEQARRNCPQLRRGALNAPAGLQSSENGEPPARRVLQLAVFSVDQQLAAQRCSHIEVSSDFHAREIGRRYADDSKRLPVNCESAIEHGTVAAVFVLPKGIADGHTRRTASWLIVFHVQQPPPRRPYAKRFEKLAADPQPLHVMHFATRRYVESVGAPCKDLREALLLFANLLPQLVRQIRITRAETSGPAASMVDCNSRDFLWVFHRESAQPHCIDQLKNRRVGADS